jgi:DNA-binding NarL/FixJ family response regulator
VRDAKTPSKDPLRGVIAEDSGLLREGLARLLTDASLDVVAKVGDGPGLIAAAEQRLPDVAVVDVRMPPGYRDEGRSNHAIARTLYVTAGAVEKHVKNFFGKLGLAQTEDDHRRVLAVLTYLRG